MTIELQEHIEGIIANERAKFRQLILEAIPLGNYSPSELIMSLNDMNKILGRLE